MRVLWIEDHHLIGDALEELLRVKMPEVSLDKARDLEMALRLAGAIRYELVLLDWWLGHEDGEHAIRSLRAAGCSTRIVVVSGDEREPVMQRAMAAGAVGYVSKSSEPDRLMDSIRLALSGVISRPQPTQWSSDTGSTAPGPLPSIDIVAAFPDLTARQADVFRALIRGHSDKRIARDLGISDTTVKTHVRAILQSVGVHKRGEAAHLARLRGAGG